MFEDNKKSANTLKRDVDKELAAQIVDHIILGLENLTPKPGIGVKVLEMLIPGLGMDIELEAQQVDMVDRENLKALAPSFERFKRNLKELGFSDTTKEALGEMLFDSTLKPPVQRSKNNPNKQSDFVNKVIQHSDKIAADNQNKTSVNTKNVKTAESSSSKPGNASSKEGPNKGKESTEKLRLIESSFFELRKNLQQIGLQNKTKQALPAILKKNESLILAELKKRANPTIEARTKSDDIIKDDKTKEDSQKTNPILADIWELENSFGTLKLDDKTINGLKMLRPGLIDKEVDEAVKAIQWQEIGVVGFGGEIRIKPEFRLKLSQYMEEKLKKIAGEIPPDSIKELINSIQSNSKDGDPGKSVNGSQNLKDSDPHKKVVDDIITELLLRKDLAKIYRDGIATEQISQSVLLHHLEEDNFQEQLQSLISDSLSTNKDKLEKAYEEAVKGERKREHDYLEARIEQQKNVVNEKSKLIRDLEGELEKLKKPKPDEAQIEESIDELNKQIEESQKALTDERTDLQQLKESLKILEPQQNPKKSFLDTIKNLFHSDKSKQPDTEKQQTPQSKPSFLISLWARLKQIFSKNNETQRNNNRESIPAPGIRTDAKDTRDDKDKNHKVENTKDEPTISSHQTSLEPTLKGPEPKPEIRAVPQSEAGLPKDSHISQEVIPPQSSESQYKEELNNPNNANKIPQKVRSYTITNASELQDVKENPINKKLEEIEALRTGIKTDKESQTRPRSLSVTAVEQIENPAEQANKTNKEMNDLRRTIDWLQNTGKQENLEEREAEQRKKADPSPDTSKSPENVERGNRRNELDLPSEVRKKLDTIISSEIKKEVRADPTITHLPDHPEIAIQNQKEMVHEPTH